MLEQKIAKPFIRTKYRSINRFVWRKEERTAFWFVAPFIIGFLLFYMFPTFYALVISFLDYNSFRELKNLQFVGLDNYSRIFNDVIALSAYVKSFLFTAIFVPVQIILALLLAVLFNKKFYMKTFSRTLIMMPYVTNIVAVTIVFSILLNPFDGIVNTILKAAGVEEPPLWLGGIDSALPTVALIQVWHTLAFPTITFLGALQAVPAELYEAADIDGASHWKKLRLVMLPMISPTTFFLVVTGIIGSFQNYAIFKNLTNGGPGTSSRVISLNIYEEAFVYNHFSYASAQAILLFLFILGITLFQWGVQKKWVHY